jgi:pimeloyl-ACP methyl ester carboxylesterase
VHGHDLAKFVAEGLPQTWEMLYTALAFTLPGMKRLFLAALLGFVACAPAVTRSNIPLPNPADLERVNAERLEIPGFQEIHTPEALNKAYFVRYSLPHDGKAKAVIVLMPGFLGGVANFDRVARGIVTADPSLEVWAVDRRSNALEDRAVLDEAWTKRDPMLAWRYHIRDAGTPKGFTPRQPKELGFMGYWGLETHLEDLRRVILFARGYGTRVILGGHSLGAAMVSLYAGWDFAGAAGYKDIDGLILLDGAAGNTGGSGITEKAYLEGQPGALGISTPGVRALEGGTATPYFNALGFDPLGLSKLSAASLLAGFDPSGDSPGGIVPYRASNLAAGLVTGDDNYSPISIFSISAGRATNAQIAINGLGIILGSGLTTLEVTGIAPGSNRVEWQTPPQDDAVEVTDPLDFARRFYTPNGDFEEWYFPLRLSLDISAAGLESPAWASTLHVRHVAETKLPTLAAIAGRGIVTAETAFKPLEAKTGQSIEKKLLPGYTHLDVLAARANPLVGWIVEFAGR